MISVIHLITTINRGGAENHLQSLIEKQISNNYNLVVISLKGITYWKTYFEDNGVKVFKFKSVFQLISIIRNNKIQIPHAHLQVPEILSFAATTLSPKFHQAYCFSRHNDACSRFSSKMA